MKKILALISVISLLAVFVSCASDTKTDGNAEKADSSSENIYTADYEVSGEYIASVNTPYTVSYPAPGTSDYLPDTIPSEMLDSLCEKLDSSDCVCAMYYCDIRSGLTISYNEDRIFGAASLIKAPYLYYIFDMIEKGDLSLDDVHTYQKKYHYFAGTGKVKSMEDGTELTLKEIIEYIVYYSDNTAFKMLYNTSGTSGGVYSLSSFHHKALKEFNAPFISGNLTVLSAGGVGRIFTEIYKRSETSELYAWYLELLKKANENVFIRNGIPKDENGVTLYEVAHKYGMDIKASNDAAIVLYKDRPYVLVVLTDYLLNGSNVEFIIDISSSVFNIHEYICGDSATAE